MVARVICTMVTAILLAASAAGAATLEVPVQYPTIQGAIDAAVDGDTVAVAPGTYQENIVISKLVDVKGAGRDVTFLGSAAGWPKDAVKIYVNGITFSGFTVDGGVLCYGASPVIEKNTIKNSGQQPYGLYAAYNWANGRSSNPVIQNNLITNCPDGIQLFWSQAIIRNNIIVRNNGYGINVSWAWPTIENNTIANNGAGGVENFSYSNATIRNNIISGNGRYGILNYYHGRLAAHVYNLVADNAIADFASYGDSEPITRDATELNAPPAFVNAPQWTSGVSWGPFGKNYIGISSGWIYGEDHTIGAYERGNVIVLSFDDVPRTVTKVENDLVYFAPDTEARPVSGTVAGYPPIRIVNYLGKNRNVMFDWSLLPQSPAIYAGDPDPAYNNIDGTRNTIGATGGPFAAW